MSKNGIGICKHCRCPIKGGVHLEGLQRGLMRCDPGDSGLPYGFNAEIEGEECGPICLGSTKKYQS